MNLFITADTINNQTGGGSVTHHELEALKKLGPVEVISRNIYNFPQDPFEQDLFVLGVVKHNIMKGVFRDIKLVHAYSGCLSQTIRYFKERGVKVTYTAAAHDKDLSRREHELLGWSFPYPHLTDPELWKNYLEGYLLADRLITPSKLSQECMKRYGYNKEILVIPHGVDIPDVVGPYPDKFTVGYLGAIGPDKGVRYLLEAWKKLNYEDSVLFLAGANSNSQLMKDWIKSLDLKNVYLAGWVPSHSYFYNSITVYVQPSLTEGFGLEVLEAMSFQRPVICSSGVGAVDFISNYHQFAVGNVDQLCTRIREFKGGFFKVEEVGKVQRDFVKNTATWDIIENQYESLWRSMI